MRTWLLLFAVNIAAAVALAALASRLLAWPAPLLDFLVVCVVLAGNTPVLARQWRAAGADGAACDAQPDEGIRIFLDPVCAQDMGNAFAWIEAYRPATGWIASPRRWWAAPEGRHRKDRR